MSVGAIYSNRKDIQSVNYVDFHVRAGPSNTELETAVTINKHILLGLFPTAALAIEALEGALVKVGCKQPKQRRIKLIANKEALFTGADFVPTTPVWGTTITNTYSLSGNTTSYGRVATSSALAAMTVPLLLRFELTGTEANNKLWQIWVKVKSVSSGETTGSPQTTGYTRVLDNNMFYLPVGQFLHIKGEFTGTVATSTTFSIYNAYTETLLDTITFNWTTTA